ncbi:1-O-acylceramide synthase precursor, putative [Entamoeba invadens IP1]|nr:1-O-acylceramide synthase precursor, putative [Entamoeba invadens IP1]ELP94166.1 1-O-acylceramide synthase precursor, putative [Entamoeba invadens IP1]|eukprot:XP_004260937.1 1-O-acylceramide synthase precursor, putative [Entamoeba invadens IP1]
MEGVTITVPDFGSTYALDSIDPNWPISLATKAFHDLIKKFEKDLGYTDGVDMLGAPYDWRYFRFDEYSHKENWYENTKNLIKKAYETNGNKQVVLISHSMGGLMTYKLLDYMGEEFTKKYVKRWVAMSGPFLGAAKTIAAAFPGNNLDLPISAAKLRPVCRRAETISFLFPTGGNANWGETPLMTIKSTGKVYTVDDMLELLGTLDDDFKKQHSYVYENGINGLYKKYNNKMPFGIETQCLISSQYETILGVTMDTPDYDTGKATLTYGDGDGTVNIQSLEYCAKLGGIVQNVGKYDHTGMLDDKASYSYLKNFICN